MTRRRGNTRTRIRTRRMWERTSYLFKILQKYKSIPKKKSLLGSSKLLSAKGYLRSAQRKLSRLGEAESAKIPYAFLLLYGML